MAAIAAAILAAGGLAGCGDEAAGDTTSASTAEDAVEAPAGDGADQASEEGEAGVVRDSAADPGEETETREPTESEAASDVEDASDVEVLGGDARCYVLWGLEVPASSVYNDTLGCSADAGTEMVLLPPGTAPLDAYAVPMDEFALPDQMNGLRTVYSFTVTGIDWVCTIRPSETDGRGTVGCQGSFEEGWTAEAPDSPGQAPVNTIELDESGPVGITLGEALHMPYIDNEFLGADRVSVLEEGKALYAYGIGCAATAEATLSCTAGESASFTATPSTHAFTPENADG